MEHLCKYHVKETSVISLDTVGDKDYMRNIIALAFEIWRDIDSSIKKDLVISPIFMVVPEQTRLQSLFNRTRDSWANNMFHAYKLNMRFDHCRRTIQDMTYTSNIVLASNVLFLNHHFPYIYIYQRIG